MFVSTVTRNCLIHCEGFVKFNFIDKLLYMMKNDSGGDRLSAYNSKDNLFISVPIVGCEAIKRAENPLLQPSILLFIKLLIVTTLKCCMRLMDACQDVVYRTLRIAT